MFDYQKALEILTMNEQARWKKGYDEYDIQEAKDKLWELATRAKPVKLDERTDQYVDDEILCEIGECPCCGFHLAQTAMTYKYCPNCGQRLDWSKEDELVIKEVE